jgi:hypothetical protein
MDSTMTSRFIKTCLMTAFIAAFGMTVRAQVKPPRPISVYKVQDMIFGAFNQGSSGGTVTLDPSGSRSTTGSISLFNLGFPYHAATFEIDANPGTLITIMNGPDATLTGSNGGSITLQLGSSSPSSPLITNAVPPARTAVHIGGTLLVGSPIDAPTGTYSGSFYVIFVVN